MERHWEALRELGMPDGAARRQRPVSLDGMRDSVRALRDADLSTAQREVLLAWLRAFQHEFPRRFAAELGEDGVQLIAVVECKSVDVNRYLKLRRIAVENLSKFL